MPQRECRDGWITSYLEYTKPQQSPTIFHCWTALSTIASAMRRRCWIDRSFYILYPNLYIILVSESGVGMKSTAIKIGTNTFLGKAVPDLTIMRGAITVKFLVDWMSQALAKSPDQTAEVTIFCEEFKVFAKGLYSDSGLIENLTKIYDCGIWEYGTGGQGIYKIDKPCINLLAGSTPEWLTTGSAADFIGGGFSSRIIPVAILKDEKQVANPKRIPLSDELEKRLVADLTQISKLSGPFFVTKEAEDFFEKWYLVRDKYKNQDQRMKGFYAKKHDMVLKVAMAVSVSINDDMVITEEHIESALSLLGKIELTMPYAYQGVAWGEKAKFQDKVWSKISEVGMIQHAKLLEAFHYCMTGDDLKAIIHTLVDEDKVGYDRLATAGRTKIVYITEVYIREQCKKEGEDVTKKRFSICSQSHPEWFEPEKKNGKDKK